MQCLPVAIAFGTNNEKLLNDEFYIRPGQKRLLDEFRTAVKKNYGEKLLIQLLGSLHSRCKSKADMLILLGGLFFWTREVDLLLLVVPRRYKNDLANGLRIFYASEQHIRLCS
ncbi:hypothetical protein POTOM_000715 [Populus tomentosa]|uniref:Malic enzyme N-terminal domain-containing protein n=1 Tax=Populus tomentosa TaxID=118781 RepID=A0A8X8DGL6_POPTO|nr:hypothetical protein POTOM_000715 [Populus tomentosa]